jgi:hypothetical protein
MVGIYRQEPLVEIPATAGGRIGTHVLGLYYRCKGEETLRLAILGL